MSLAHSSGSACLGKAFADVSSPRSASIRRPASARRQPRSLADPAGYIDTLRAVPSRWKVLIVDQYTQAMLHSVLSTYDVLEEGIQRASRFVGWESLDEMGSAVLSWRQTRG